VTATSIKPGDIFVKRGGTRRVRVVEIDGFGVARLQRIRANGTDVQVVPTYYVAAFLLTERSPWVLVGADSEGGAA